MPASSAGTRHGSGLAVLVWVVPPLLELGGLLMVYAGLPDLVEDVGLGSPATEVLVSVLLVVTIVGAVPAWRGTPGGIRLATAAALFVAAGLTAALGLSFITGGALAVFTILMLHAAVSIALIGRAVLRSSLKPLEGR